MQIQTEKSVTTRLVLANGVSLIAAVIEEVAGEEISNHLNGEAMYGNALEETLAVKLQAKLAPFVTA